MRAGILAGCLAGAAGTAALNAVTYLDMAVRGRPPSSTPQESIEVIAGRLRLTIPGAGEARDNRVDALGALTGIAAGVGVGGVFGLLRRLGMRPTSAAGTLVVALAAMAAANLPMSALKVTDPRSWTAADWLSDLVPHLAYGAVTATTLHALDCD